MTEDERVPLEQVLPGAGVHPLEAGWTPLQAFVLIKALDEDGDPTWAFRTTEPMNLEELLGALSVQEEVLRRRLVRLWEEEN